jgi:predicted ATP-grasp superfamily ATP-dependent carboligase
LAVVTSKVAAGREAGTHDDDLLTSQALPPPDSVRVVVTGGQYPGALAAIRSLHRAGFAPWAVATSSSSYVSFSRAAAKMVVAPPVASSAQGFVQAVAKLCTTERTVLIPGTEADLVALVDGRHLLPPSVLGLPSVDTLRRVTDKLALTAAATSAGFSAPATDVVRAGAFETDTAFPYVVKPLHTVIREGDTLVSLSAVAIESPRQLIEFKRQLGATEAVVQPLLRGRLNALAGVMWQGRLLAPMQQVALSVFPKPCGGSAVARTVPTDPTICERAERLMRELGCEGIVQLQWLDDDEKQYVIDLNPRIYGSLALANAAGSKLAVVWTKLLLGQELDASPAPRDVLYRNLETFLRAGGRHAVFAPKAADGTANSVFALDDPLPVLGSVARGAKKLRRDLRGAAKSKVPVRKRD